MTIDEAIRIEEETARRSENHLEYNRSHKGHEYEIAAGDCEQSMIYHRQLAEWLRDYKRLLDVTDTNVGNIDHSVKVSKMMDGDYISRQAVNTLVDELARAISDERCCLPRGRSIATIMQDILDLPSVNPQPCEDAISRQAALDCLTATGLKKYDYILNARNKIKNLPSVKPQEPKTGHWIEGKYSADDIRYNDYSYKCDKCGKVADFKENFCPNCGCRIVGEKDGR